MTIKSWKVRRRVCIAATTIVVAVWLVLMWAIPDVVMIVQYLVGACAIGWCMGWYVPEFVNNLLKPR